MSKNGSNAGSQATIRILDNKKAVQTLGNKKTKLDDKTAKTDLFKTATLSDAKKTETVKGLESLLYTQDDKAEIETTNDKNTTDNHINNDSQVNKTEKLEVKINEAKQMIKYLSQDVKTAIDDYKSPFTRIKVQLNPNNLGEVDLTVIQRGKDLVVNLSSNNTAINTLAMNSNDLKTQLSNSGINNATLNFSNSSQNEQQQSSNQQNQRQAQKEYNYFENEEQNEEILSSLEIVVPSYA